MADGTLVRGETNIDIPKHDGSQAIHRLYLEPPATIYREAYEAILAADLIIIGPGDLYSSILPNILVRGTAEALKQIRGRSIYIPNLMSKWGETYNFQSSDLVRELLCYLDMEQLDRVICNNQPFNKELLKKYSQERSFPIKVDRRKLKPLVNEIIEKDILWQSDIIRHDAGKLARVIMDLV